MCIGRCTIPPLKGFAHLLLQERSHIEVLRQQLEHQRESAAVGAHAWQTIQGLERELASCRSLMEQRTREAEALQRTVRLSDEMTARLKGQLEGLLRANQAAVAREQELEQQVRHVMACHLTSSLLCSAVFSCLHVKCRSTLSTALPAWSIDMHLLKLRHDCFLS